MELLFTYLRLLHAFERYKVCRNLIQRFRVPSKSVQLPPFNSFELAHAFGQLA